MGTPVGDIEISDSYKGILRVSSNDEGVDSDERIVYTSDGKDSALSLGTVSATFTGTLKVDEIITDSLTTPKLDVTDTTTFNETVVFNGDISSSRIFTNIGEFKNDATGIINSIGQANFTNIQCTGTAIFDGSLTFTDVIEVTPSYVTISVPFNSQGTSTFNDIKVDNISSAVESGSINFKSPVMVTSSLTTTGTISIGGILNINATVTKINSKVTCTSTAELDFTEAKSVLAKTQEIGDNSNAVATTEFVQRSIGGGSNMVPDYRNAFSVTTPFTAPTNGYILLITGYNQTWYGTAINSITFVGRTNACSGKYGTETFCLPIAADDTVEFWGMAGAFFIPSK